MLGMLARLLQPLPSRGYDHLFTTFAPKGASAGQLRDLYHRYDDAFPDEPAPPQHKHFRALVDAIVANDNEAVRADSLQRVRAAYVSCFEQSAAFAAALRQWKREPGFRASLILARREIIAELSPSAASDARRRKHFERWSECLAARIDLDGETLTDLIKQMGPDDWHEIALKWNWGLGAAELEWITSQRSCDRATALYVLCAGKAGDVAMGRPNPHARFLRDLAARLEGGFYPKAELGLSLSMRLKHAFEAELDAARGVNESPWRLPQDLLDHEGVRAHRPKYAVSNGIAHYHYEYWLSHVAR